MLLLLVHELGRLLLLLLLRVQGSGFRIQSLVFKVQGIEGYRV